MPKLGSMSESVFYLFGLDPQTGKIRGPDGTGVFIARVPSSRYSCIHIYAVTNRHLAAEGASIIRVNTRGKNNTKGDTSRFVKFEPIDWHYPEDGDDLAIIDVTDHIDPDFDDVIALYEEVFITPEIIKEFQIGQGDDTFMCGLFASHDGGTRNAPVQRFGNISLMPTDDAPVRLQNTGAKLPCYLVDTRSRSGFSGSPVFSFRTRQSDINGLPYGWDRSAKTNLNPIIPRNDFYWGLLGIHCGQFWDPVEVRTKPDEASTIKDGDTIFIQSGMTIVIPAWKISRLLDSEEFELARKKREKEFEPENRKMAKPESISHDSSTDENPNHREGFTSLLNAAARKPKQDE